MSRSKAKLCALRPGSVFEDSCDEELGTPVRSQEYFTSTQHKDEDLISFNIEYAKYLGDSYSLPSLRPQTPDSINSINVDENHEYQEVQGSARDSNMGSARTGNGNSARGTGRSGNMSGRNSERKE